ncbi:MAG: bifunctional 4-hydroxy-2-oxoglutarate aldolase/2-dehydro-3-deoxy-phosphogluconate aldolase [Planctomycetota bacterium]|nr:bifunctional 4-hydroxy-2-oxoglutarate aldolase/2-dehydro-3-deoxy-phosphogluconate aldolase [Planctomycetota bacterium]MDA1180265.1 bifunctional 4-hydroxy-2-oxoglutarate aldolase/2-dehydro-3-deoxy-phosphogluconate aldolase [Planctomycetota bacterium]
MSNHQILTQLLQQGIVAVLRCDRGDQLLETCRALHAGGVSAMEVTFTVPRAEKVLERVADELGDQILLGAGTILDEETARVAMLAGARFLVSPVVRAGVIAAGNRYGVPVMPGALTPTEILTAWEAGAAVVKVFPADLGGPAYFKALRAPLPQIRLMPTGGVDLDTAEDFLKAGAVMLGVGGCLVSAADIHGAKFTEITERARKFQAIVRRFRETNPV